MAGMMHSAMHLPVTEYDGCGMCLLASRRLSRVGDDTLSPEMQAEQDIELAASVGGHIIGWADDFEVSGATDPMTRPGLGPWLREERGPYDGVVAAEVDRIGRNLRDCLNTADMLTRQRRVIVTNGHDGPWDLNDPEDENMFTLKAFGAQWELRAIQKRNRNTTQRVRGMGKAKQKACYGSIYVRLFPTAGVDHVAVDPEAAAIAREVKDRILSDETGKTTAYTETARLNRERVLNPGDQRRKHYGKPLTGAVWSPKSLILILTSEASVGWLMHEGRPVLGRDGARIRLWAGLWDEETRQELIKATAPKRPQPGRAALRAPRGTAMLVTVAECGVCGHAVGSGSDRGAGTYRCTARGKGFADAGHCAPAPTIVAAALEAHVTTVFLDRFGHVPHIEKTFRPGNGKGSRMTELTADLRRLRSDREAGLYDSAIDEAWFQDRYRALTTELKAVEQMPDEPGRMVWTLTGKTLADRWHQAPDNAARRELLTIAGIRVLIFPARHRPIAERCTITALDPETFQDAANALRELTEAEREARIELATASRSLPSTPHAPELDLAA